MSNRIRLATYIVNGKEYIGLKTAAHAAGVCVNTFYKYLEGNEYKPFEGERSDGYRNFYVVAGVKYKTGKEAVKAAGVSTQTFYKYLDADGVFTPPTRQWRGSRTKIYIVDGKEYAGGKAASQAAGVSWYKFYKNLVGNEYIPPQTKEEKQKLPVNKAKNYLDEKLPEYMVRIDRGGWTAFADSRIPSQVEERIKTLEYLEERGHVC